MDERKDYYVYIWYIKGTNEVFYIGKGTGRRYKQTSNRNKFFNDMYKSHDCDVKKIYENLTEAEAFQKEMETIKWYRENTDFRLTNQTDGGEGSSGWKPPQDFRDKQAKIQKEQWQDEEFKKKMMAIRTDENGPYKSQEFRDKISQLVQGENNPNYNNHWTDEMKQHLSQVRKANGLSADENNPKATRIICLETGEVFNCIKYAMQKYNIKHEGSMTVALKNPMRTAGGKHWVLYAEKYLDDNYRLNYLIDVCLLNPKVTPVICIEDKIVFSNASTLAKYLEVTEAYVRYHLNKKGFVNQNHKRYIKLSEYKNYEVAV
jgi:hypothetical protein